MTSQNPPSMENNIVNDEAKIAAMKDEIVREYLKLLQLTPEHIDRTLRLVVQTCNKISSFKSIIVMARFR